MIKKALIVLSGGLDSSVLLRQAVSLGYVCEAVSFNYGQRHDIELKCAVKTCRDLNVPHDVIAIPFLHDIADSSLTHKKDTPHGHYEAESMKDTVVPGRNLIMASIALSLAVKLNSDALFMGIHAGDHAIYPDCRPEFLHALQKIANVFDEKHVQVIAPFILVSKGEIVRIGHNLGVAFEDTWTCYDPQEGGKACGKCGSCQERLEAFAENNLVDPLEYV